MYTIVKDESRKRPGLTIDDNRRTIDIYKEAKLKLSSVYGKMDRKEGK